MLATKYKNYLSMHAHSNVIHRSLISITILIWFPLLLLFPVATVAGLLLKLLQNNIHRIKLSLENLRNKNNNVIN